MKFANFADVLRCQRWLEHRGADATPVSLALRTLYLIQGTVVVVGSGRADLPASDRDTAGGR